MKIAAGAKAMMRWMTGSRSLQSVTAWWRRARSDEWPGRPIKRPAPHGPVARSDADDLVLEGINDRQNLATGGGVMAVLFHRVENIIGRGQEFRRVDIHAAMRCGPGAARICGQAAHPKNHDSADV